MSKIYIFGHQKPDTDSVTSSIALSHLKNALNIAAEPRILSKINQETKFVLEYFDVKTPQYLDSVKLRLKDIDYYRDYYIHSDNTLNDLYEFLVNNQITGVPIVDKDKKLLGIVTLKDIMMYMKDRQNYIHTSYANLKDLLESTKGHNISDSIEGYVTVKNNCIFILSDDISTIITSKDSKEGYKNITKFNVIESSLNLVDILRLIPWSNYISDIVKPDRCYNFNENTYYDDFIKETNKLKFNNYPIIGKKGTCKGLIRLTDIKKKHKTKVILVDHNEPQQSVDGLEEAEILEIVDHHKIGTTTNNPISFRNMTVGSTNTIIYMMYKENNIEIPYDIGGLMLSGILSDTLGLTSSTTTDIDIKTVNELSELLKIDYQKYYYQMLEAGTSLEGQTKEEIIKQDLKFFQINNMRYAISQIITLDIDNILKDKKEYLIVLDNYKKSNELKLMILIITDAIKKGSYLLYTDGVESMIKEIYHLSDVYQGVFVDDLTSRKKQVVPYINEYLK